MKKTFQTEKEMIDFVDILFKQRKDVVQVSSDYKNGEWIIKWKQYDIQAKNSKM